MIIKYAIALAILLAVAAFMSWAFLPARYLPGNRARSMRLRLHLRLHPGKGFATVFSLWLHWSRLPIEPRNLKRSFDARCAKAGVRQIKIHDTRRTCGSLVAALDVHPRVAMAILRHSRIALTMEVYTQVPDKTTRDALKRLSDWLDRPGGTVQCADEDQSLDG